MRDRLKTIGFNRRVDLEWLGYTANLVLAGQTREEMHKNLTALLQDKLSVGSDAKRGSREKTISILLKIWFSAPGRLKSFHDRALSMFRQLPIKNHLVLHWGMSMAVYPFFGVVAETAGRLLALQDTVTPAQVQRRMKELYGEKESVSRPVRFILRNFVNWGVLDETAQKGLYKRGVTREVTDINIVSWLIEAVLISIGNNSASLKSITHNPSLFPFNISLPHSKALEESKRLEIIHHGLNEEVIMLRKDGTLRP